MRLSSKTRRYSNDVADSSYGVVQELDFTANSFGIFRSNNDE